MAKRWIDGEVFDGPDGDVQDIEDVLYGENQNILLCDSPEEFSAASEEFIEAQLLEQLRYHEGFKALLAKADREAQYAINNRANFKRKSSADDVKKEKLDTEMEHAVSRRDWIRQTVENATSVQKPTLRKK